MNFNKKISFVFLSLLMLSVFAVSFASAAEAGSSAGFGDEVNTLIDGAINTLSPVTSLLFGADKSSGEAGFLTLMAFLLTLLVIVGVLSPLKIFGDKPSINWAIAAIVAIIGVRYIPINALRAFTLPSEGLVGALFLIVPFIIVATLILKAQSAAVRKSLWIIYAVIMATLWVRVYKATTGWTAFYWVYVVILVICIIAFSMDGTIQGFLRRNKAGRNLESVNSREVDRINARISDLETALGGATTDAQRVDIQKQIDIQKKNLKALIK